MIQRKLIQKCTSSYHRNAVKYNLREWSVHNDTPCVPLLLLLSAFYTHTHIVYAHIHAGLHSHYYLQSCKCVRKEKEFLKKERRERQFNFSALPLYLSSFSEYRYHGDIDSPTECYGFHKTLLLRGHRDKPGQFQAGILHSYFIWRSYFITVHTIFTLGIQYAVGVICLNHLLVFFFVCCWCVWAQTLFIQVSYFGKMSEPIHYHECMRTPAGHLLTTFPFQGNLQRQLL